jgi:uncharacterized HAD superfamily protein
MRESKKIKIGFDLDGTLVDKPFLIPNSLIQWLFKGHRKGLDYRFPKTKLEQFIRRLSHFYLFRPPIKLNLKFLKKIANNKDCRLYLISSRYSFLKKETRVWLEKRAIKNLFQKIELNHQDQPPYLFKEKKLRQLGVEVYFEDDPAIAGYLKKKLPRTKICLVGRSSKIRTIQESFKICLK